MKQQPALFSYRHTDSLIHRIPAWIKLLLLCIVTFRTFSNSSYGITNQSIIPFLPWIRAGFYFILSAVFFFLAKTPFSSLKRLSFILWLGFFMLLISFFSVTIEFNDKNNIVIFNTTAIISDGLYIFRFFTTTLFSLIIFETTSRLEIMEVLSLLEKKISKIFPFAKKLQLSLILSVAITFIPEIFNCWYKVSLAATARSPIGKHGKRKISLSIINAQFSAFFFNMLQYAEQVRRAINNRSNY